MATVRNVIDGALQKLGVVGQRGHGRQASLQDYSDSLDVLQSMYRTMITSGAFGQLRDVVPTADHYVACENQRVFRRHNEQQEILLPDMMSNCGRFGYCNERPDHCGEPQYIPNPDYGRFPYNGFSNDKRPVYDNSVVVLVDEFTGDVLEAIYDGQTKRWFTLPNRNEELDETNEWNVKRLNDILDSEAPLSSRDANGLKSYLAIHLSDTYLSDVSDTTLRQANTFKMGIMYNHSSRPTTFYDMRKY